MKQIRYKYKVGQFVSVNFCYRKARIINRELSRHKKRYTIEIRENAIVKSVFSVTQKELNEWNLM